MVHHVTVCRHATRGILTSFAPWPKESVAPFLYQTQSITRCYSSLQTSAERAEDHGARGGRSPAERGRLRRPQRTFGGIRTGQGARVQSRPAPRIEHVPFEGVAAKAAVVDSALSDGSTVTPSERRAFESLLALSKSVTAGKNVAGAASGDTQDIQTKRNTGGKETDVQSDGAQGNDLDIGTGTSSTLDARSAAEIKIVNSLMVDAQTDADLWRVLHEKVISRVLALQLDTPGTATDGPSQAKAPSKKSKGKKSKTSPITTTTNPAEPAPTTTASTPAFSAQDSHLLTQTFPVHLLNFAKQCASSFPGSSLAPNLLPYIKSLGPTAFAMAATTSLYNHHMSQLYYQYLDLPSIITTLEEMDQQVYEFDTATYNLLGKISHRANEARLGHLGPGTQALWDGERLQAALKGVAQWKAKVLEQMEARALQAARSKSTLHTHREGTYVDPEM